MWSQTFGRQCISDFSLKSLLFDLLRSYCFQVVSGCEWGNILLWEEGLITLEICRKNRLPCHAKAITQFEYMNGELISIGKNPFYIMLYGDK